MLSPTALAGPRYPARRRAHRRLRRARRSGRVPAARGAAPRADRRAASRSRYPSREPRRRSSVFAGARLDRRGVGLYVLLPGNVHVAPTAFLAVFVTAMVAGVASQIQAGSASFECIVLASLDKPHHGSGGARGAAGVPRRSFYLLPLAIARCCSAASGRRACRGSLKRIPAVRSDAGSRWSHRGCSVVSTFLGGVAARDQTLRRARRASAGSRRSCPARRRAVALPREPGRLGINRLAREARCRTVSTSPGC